MGKEWNGNSNSVAAQIGLGTTWHPEERAADDFYTTDPESLRTFAGHFKLDKIVWEPACGTGNLSKVLEELCVKVYSSDLRNRGYGESGINFLDCERVPDGVTSIITNPPYKLANEFIEHAMEILPKDGTYIALLLRMQPSPALISLCRKSSRGWLYGLGDGSVFAFLGPGPYGRCALQECLVQQPDAGPSRLS